MDWSELIPDLIKVPYNAYKYRHLIQKFWINILAKLEMGDTDIVMLGGSGVGKTYLSKFIHGQAPKFSYKAGQSPDVETEAIQFGEWSRLVRVIPGQYAVEKVAGIEEAFNSQSLEGIIYVVDWGYDEIRGDALRLSLIKDQGLDTIDKFREYHLKKEIKDLEFIAKKVKDNHAMGRGPKWFVIAVNKIDLYFDKIDDAQRYYSPEFKSDFTDVINEMLHTVGTVNLKCVALPISSWQKGFEWNGQISKTDIGGRDNEHGLGLNFISKIGEFTKLK